MPGKPSYYALEMETATLSEMSGSKPANNNMVSSPKIGNKLNYKPLWRLEDFLSKVLS